MTFVIILVVSLALVPVFALVVYRRVETGEARFDKHGRTLGTEPEERDREPWTVAIREEE